MDDRSGSRQLHPSARRGNALVAALAVMAMIAVAVVVSTDEAISVHGETFRRAQQTEALAAAEAVLAKRQGWLLKLANADQLRLWTGGTDPAVGVTPPADPLADRDHARNYGVDFIGRCAVLWKVEPARSMAPTDTPSPSDSFRFVENPSPDLDYLPSDPNEVTNEYTYMYHLQAEARLQLSDTDEPLAKAQGSRYIAITGEPLFRYAIFYGKDGPKGDLELSHGPGVTIHGGVYSNGAIYIGSGTSVNEWSALTPASGPTLIGPATNGKPVRCIGMDGIFRLGKPIIYSLFNGYPVNGAPAFTPSAGNYSLGSGFPPNTDPPDATFGSVGAATDQFTRINPYRILDNQFATRGVSAREINAKPIVGVNGGGLTANDSRDAWRPSSEAWNPLSLTNFNRRALTRVTNAPKKVLPDTMKNRPLEMQQLVYPDEGTTPPFDLTDNPADDIDEHLKAQPMFLDIDANPDKYSAAVDVDGAGPLGVAEVPGTYARYALGDPDSFFVRKTQPFFTGWEVRKVNAVSVSPATPAAMAGLIIRERPVPDFSYYDSTPPDLDPVKDWNAYFPFAYGKHKRPLLWPFTALFVSDRGVIGTDAPPWRANGRYMGLPMVTLDESGCDRSYAQTNEAYSAGGYVEINANTHAKAWNSWDSPMDDGGWYRSNWRFVHLRKATVVSPTTPRVVDLSDTNSYFDSSAFRAIQARVVLEQLEGGSTETDNRGRKMGLMIHPVDVAGAVAGELPATGTDLEQYGINSRKPFAAMLYSPERGPFSQRRFESSWIANAGTAFTNSGADGFAEPGTATVWQVGSRYDNQVSGGTDVSRWGEPPTTFNLINSGEGYFSLRGGPYDRNVSKWSTGSSQSTLYLTLELSDPAVGAGFIPFDAGRSTIEVYAGAYGGPGAGGGITTVFSPTRVEAKFGTQNGPSTTGAAVTLTDTTRSSVSANTIYKWYMNDDKWNPQPVIAGQWNEAAAFLGGDAQLKTALEGMGYTVDMSLPPTDPDPVPPPVALPPLPTPPSTVTIGGAPNAVDSRLFRVTRGGRVELNSLISQRGAWYNPAPLNTAAWTASTQADIPQYLPNFTGVLADKYPLTSSYRPDLFAGRPGGSISYAEPTYTEASTGTLPAGCGVVANPWLDAQIPQWPNGGDSPVGKILMHNGRCWKCAVSPGSGTAAQAPGVDATWIAADQVWLRIEKSGTTLKFKYYIGTDPDYKPVAADFIEMTDNEASGAPAQMDTTGWPTTWMIGVAAQGGTIGAGDWGPVHAVFGDISLEFNGTAPGNKRAPDDVLDYQDWEDRNPSDPTDMTRYLCSQYQAFWGTQEITEDFFRYGENDGPRGRAATEDWFYNLREFWSQSRWWNEGDYLPDGTKVTRASFIERETGSTTPPTDPWDSKWRQLWARTTVLNLNMKSLQKYLRSYKVGNVTVPRTLAHATAERIWGTSPTMPNIAGGPLINQFSGLIIAARTNRYPYNPQPWRASASANPRADMNPFNPDLPNLATTIPGPAYNPLAALTDASPLAPYLIFTTAPNAATANPPVGGGLCGGYPIKSVDFHHGVMVSYADELSWKDPSALASWSDNKLTIVTPNQLYIAGDLNTRTVGGKPTPLAVMGDTITLLSNSWRPASYQMGGIEVDGGGIQYWPGSPYPKGGTLIASAGPQWGWGNHWHRASDTSYRACFVTNNQPTTRDRARMGEGAPFVNTMLFMENWGSDKHMNYLGSLVVLDTCRYTHGFLLESNKTFGRSPYGIMGWWAGSSDCPGAADWGGQSPPAYAPPGRTMDFNLDLLTREGMPPFSPFAITTFDVGSWTRVTK